MGLDATSWLLILDWTIRLGALLFIPARHPPASARAWLLLVAFVPLLGLPMYLAFGRPWLSRRRVLRQAQASRMLRERVFPGVSDPGALALTPAAAAVAGLVQRLGDLPPVLGNEVRTCSDYDAALDALVADIAAAQLEVHLLYYIFSDDAHGQRVADALCAAAARGVRCRVLVDAVASRHLLRRHGAALRACGVALQAMLGGHAFARGGRLDLRNHRKLAVIDGRLGWIGSQNLVGPVFIPGAPNLEVVTRLRGPIVAQLQAVFGSDWYIETGEVLAPPAIVFDAASTDAPGSACAQLLPSGPAYPHENARDALLVLIQRAQRDVTLCTPYFVPDESLMRALCVAALGGVSVRLIVSRRNNQPLVYWAQRGYYDELLRSGVRIFLHGPGFLHAKFVCVDEGIGLLGSINLDVRSFALNAELGMLCYQARTVAQWRALQEGYIAHSQAMDLARWRRRPAWQRSVEGWARLADVLL